MSLREATSEKHLKAENMPFNKKMASGELTKKQYGIYLLSQYQIFSTIESKFALPHPDLARSENILDDLSEIGVETLSAPGICTKQYCDYLKSLDDYNEIFPHIYLNYMAVLMGGQILKNKVPGSGRMFEFKNDKVYKDCILAIRDEIMDEDADEVNKGYEHIIWILNELNTL